MKLYHGTSESTAIRAISQGLQPRGKRPGVWEEHPSRPDMVYLTNAYAPYFAFCASSEGEKWAVIEIDTDLLDEDLLHPDEDFLEQATRGQPWAPMMPSPDDSIGERTKFFRDHLEAWAHVWEKSLEHLGNCAYLGAIPPEAITKISLYDPNDQNILASMAFDPSISLMNYQFCGSKYRALTRWFAGYEVQVHDLDPFVHAFAEANAEGMKHLPQIQERFEALGKAVTARNGFSMMKGDL